MNHSNIRKTIFPGERLKWDFRFHAGSYHLRHYQIAAVFAIPPGIELLSIHNILLPTRMFFRKSLHDPSPPLTHFQNLDVLRFFCALMVMVLHGYIAYLSWIHRPGFLSATEDFSQPNQLGVLVETGVRNLGLGVDVFFFISGFLITYLLLAEKRETGRIHPLKFLARRSLRIWPLYFLVIALTPWWVQYLGANEPSYGWPLTFTVNFQAIVNFGQVVDGIPQDFQYPFIHFWSLGVEEQFYLFWPFLLMLLPEKALPWTFAGLILSAVVFRMLAFGLSTHYQTWIDNFTLSHFDTLAGGGLLAWFHLRKPVEIRIPGWVRILIYAAGAVVMVTIASKYLDGIWAAGFKKYLFFGFLLFWFMNYMFNPRAWFSFRRRNFLHYLGKISFGLYVFHNILIEFVIRKISYAWETPSLLVYWGSYFGIVLLVSIVSYELIEKPFLKWKKKFSVIQTG